MNTFALHLGDCLEYMRTLPDGAADLGCEIDPGYNAIARRRIEHAAAQLHLFGVAA